MNDKYKIIKREDWVQIYKNGELLEEGHSFEVEDIFNLLGIECEVEWRDDDDEIFD